MQVEVNRILKEFVYSKTTRQTKHKLCACLCLLGGLTVLSINTQAQPEVLAKHVDNTDESMVDQIFDPTIVRVADGVSMHKDIFVEPLTWSEDYERSETEVNFQVSVKVQLFNRNLYFAFTQKSFWQAYNRSESSPFRETNYNPEFFYRFVSFSKLLPDWGMDLGVEHESNGQALPLSRSWNRFYVAPYLLRNNDLFYLKLWHRFSEKDKLSPLDPKGDDNPDITDFLGYGEIHYQRRFRKQDRMNLMLRTNIREAQGATSFSYDWPSDSKDMYYRVSLWSGYGESLIDYNHSVTRFGVGVVLMR